MKSGVAGLARRVKTRVRKDQDRAFIATVGVSVLQGYMKKTGTALPVPANFPVNPELAYGAALCAAGVFSRGKSWEKTGSLLFYAGMPLIAIGARAIAAAGWQMDAVSGYNAGYEITEASGFDSSDPFDEGDL